MPGTFSKIQDGRYNCIYAIYLRGNDTCPVRVLIKTPARACNRHSPPSMCIFHSVANPLGDFDRALARSVFIVCITVPGATDRGQQCSAAGRRPRRSLSLSTTSRESVGAVRCQHAMSAPGRLRRPSPTRHNVPFPPACSFASDPVRFASESDASTMRKIARSIGDFAPFDGGI